MKNLLAGLLEAIHLAATAFLFAAAFWTARMTAPVLRSKIAGTATTTEGGGIAVGLSDVLLDRGPWIAGCALFAVAASGFLRGDGKKLIALARLAATFAALLFTLWAAMDMPDAKLYRAWNCLFVATGIHLVATAFLVGGAGRGSSAAPKPAKA